MASAALFPALLAPIEFQQHESLLDATGAPLHVAQMPVTGPFFLEDRAHQQLLSWAQGHPSPAYHDRKLVVLTGPIKSGKTALLNHVLPGMLTAQHAAFGGPKPVFFRFKFTLGEGPQAAAKRFCDAAARLAEDLGFRLTGVPATPVAALINMDDMALALALGIAKGGGELVLLIDEAQVRRRASVQATPVPALAIVAPRPALTATPAAHPPSFRALHRRP